jgi:hypothetical protein
MDIKKIENKIVCKGSVKKDSKPEQKLAMLRKIMGEVK